MDYMERGIWRVRGWTVAHAIMLVMALAHGKMMLAVGCALITGILFGAYVSLEIQRYADRVKEDQSVPTTNVAPADSDDDFGRSG